MTESDYILRVWERVSRGNPQRDVQIYRPSIQVTMGDALGKFALASISQAWRSLLDFTYSLAITGSHAAFGSNPDLLTDSIYVINNVRHSSVTRRFKPCPNREELESKIAVPGMPFAFYCVIETGIDFAYTSALTGNLSVTAVKIPTISTVPTQDYIEAMLIDIGTILAINRLLEAGMMTQDQADKARVA